MQPVDWQPNESYNPHSTDVTVVTHPTNHMFALSDITLTTDHFTNISRQVTWLVLDKCTSDEWQQILNTVANLTEVTELIITRCGLRMVNLRKLVLGRRLLIQMLMNSPNSV
jgi:hypothetical protein